MAVDLHHVSVFVIDMDRALHLFKDLLGFELLWHVPQAGGRKLSDLMNIPEMEAELAFLQSHANSVAVELVRLIHPPMGENHVRFGRPGTVGLSLMVEELDDLHQWLSEEGWTPFSPCIQMRTPEGDKVRAFCFATNEGMIMELIERPSLPEKKG